ncbi:hypothetical protein AaE_007318, partial [Aphanomyces astaci]
KIIGDNPVVSKYVQRPSPQVIGQMIHRFRHLQNDIPDTGDEVEVLQMEQDSRQCVLNADHLQARLGSA